MYSYSRSHVLYAEESILVTCGTERRQKKMSTLLQSMRIVLDDLEINCTAEFRARSKKIKN